MSYTSPFILLWCDLETTGLEVVNGSKKDQVLEGAFIVTDFDLNLYAGIHDVVKLKKSGLERMRENEYVLNMHKANGLLEDSAKADSDKTLRALEEQAIELLKTNTTAEKKEVRLAGSGIANFDAEIIRELMPELWSWLDYSLVDIGIFRRMSKMFAMKDIVNPTAASYGDTKLHRAWEDTMGHIEEAQKYKELFRETF